MSRVSQALREALDLPNQIAAWGDRASRLSSRAWRVASRWALLGIGLVTVLQGVGMARQVTRADIILSPAALYMFGGGGLATAVAGGLIFFRQRIDVAVRILTVVAGSTFAIALSYLPDEPGTGEALLTLAVIFAGALAATVLVAPAADAPAEPK